MSPRLHLERAQSLPTSGARAVSAFVLDGQVHLALPQLAKDVPGAPADMNGGDSDIGMPIFRWSGGRFEPWRTLPVHGGEDAECFAIGGRTFLATASIRHGSGPYEYNTDSTLWEWVDGDFRAFQRFPTFAAKQWRHLRVEGRDFLALAQGVVMPDLEARGDGRSTIFEWTGDRFEPLQHVESSWGYNWHHFRMGGTDYLAHADHHSPSVLLRWSGSAFEEVQRFAGKGGRAFAFFETEGAAWLAFARLADDSLLYRWDGARFASPKALPGGPGAREFAPFTIEAQLYLARANFLTGTPKAPKTDLQSTVYAFSNGRLEQVAAFPTSGCTDVVRLRLEGTDYLVVSESLSPDVRFRTDSHVWRLVEGNDG